MSFTDYQTPVPADWLNNVNYVVNQYPYSSAITYQAPYANTVSRTSTSKWSDMLSLADFGAVGDGIADDTAALNAAILAAFNTAKALYIPPAPNAYRLTSTIVLPGNTRIVGDGVFPYISQANVNTTTATHGAGAWFYINHSGVGFSAIASATTSGQQFFSYYEGIGTIRDQPQPNGAAAWAPNNNNWDFYNDTVDLRMTDVFCLNATRFSYTTGGSRAQYFKVRGQPMTAGIYTDTAYDVCDYDTIHWWPWWSQATGVTNYQFGTCHGLTMARCDTPYVRNYFSIFLQSGIYITQNANGTTTGFKGMNIDIDAANNGLCVDGSVGGCDLQLLNFRTQGRDSTSGRAIYLIAGSSTCVLRIENFRGGYYGAEVCRFDGTGHVVWFGGNTQADQWNLASGGFPAYAAISNTTTVNFAAPPYTTSPNGTPSTLSATGTFHGPMIPMTSLTTATDANGYVNIPHNLGNAPRAVFVMIDNTSTALICQVGTKSGSNVQLKFFVSTSSGPLVSSAVSFEYQFIY